MRRIAATMHANTTPMSPRVTKPASSTSPSQRATLHLPAPAGKHENVPNLPACYRRTYKRLGVRDPNKRNRCAAAKGENIPMRPRTADRTANTPVPPCIPTEGTKGGSGHTAPDAPFLSKCKHRRKCPSAPEHQDGRTASTAHPSPCAFPASQGRKGLGLGSCRPCHTRADQRIHTPLHPSGSKEACTPTDVPPHWIDVALYCPRRACSDVNPAVPRLHAQPIPEEARMGWGVLPPMHPRPCAVSTDIVPALPNSDFSPLTPPFPVPRLPTRKEGKSTLWGCHMCCVRPSVYNDTATTPRFTNRPHHTPHSPHLHISDTVLASHIADGAPPTTSGRWERLCP
ncbi:hypothetical protein C8J57DRAFT_1492326 [Mycena rebaudengoi]|nr:hypothetical protein C8J57DRAFT_1492326 [Mycena rebaudengoi]